MTAIKLNKKQKIFLETLVLKKLTNGHPNQIRNILKLGIYHTDKNSFYTPAMQVGLNNRCSDISIINSAIKNYKLYIKLQRNIQQSVVHHSCK